MFAGVEIGLAIAIGVSFVVAILKVSFPRTNVLGHLPGTNVYRYNSKSHRGSLTELSQAENYWLSKLCFSASDAEERAIRPSSYDRSSARLPHRGFLDFRCHSSQGRIWPQLDLRQGPASFEGPEPSKSSLRLWCLIHMDLQKPEDVP